MLRKIILATLVVGTVLFASGCTSPCSTCVVEEPVCTTCTTCTTCDM